jgi:hypothetical protein
MHIAALSLVFCAFSLLAAATWPSLERSDAVLTGKVLSVEKVKVRRDKVTKWELWRAKVRVREVAKQDTNWVETVALYYEQDHDDVQVCPGRPRISAGDVRQFYCVRSDVGVGEKVLFIPEAGWVTGPPELKPATIITPLPR